MTKVDLNGKSLEELGIKEQVAERLKTLQRPANNGQAQTPTPMPVSAPEAAKPQQPEWYELDRLVKYRDPLMLLAIALVVHGVAQYSVRIAEILAGLIVFGLCWLMAR